MYILMKVIFVIVYTRASTFSPLKVVQDAILSSIVKFQHTFSIVNIPTRQNVNVLVSTTKTTLVFSLENSACLSLYRNLLTLRTTQVKSTIQIAVQNGKG